MRWLVLRPSPGRWPLAARVAVSTAITAGVGWAAGDIGAGLIATLGVFTADYGTDRPYANRGIQSAIIAVALAAAVTVGAWAAALTWLAVAGVSVVAVLAVWLCAALGVGPPGGYMFVVVCAAGIGVSASHLMPWQIGLLVLGGGATAWLAQMSGAIADPRGPEKKAVAAYLRAASVGLATVRAGAVYESVRSAKMLPVLASGIPLVYAASDEGAAIVERIGAGIRTPPGDSAAMAEAIRTLLADPDLRRTMGARGREYAVQEGDWSELVGSWVESLPVEG